MALEILGTVLVCLAILVGFTLAGMSALRRGVNPKGATGTLGSVLNMIDPATGAPSRQEAAAAREELKQRRHETSQSGNGPDHGDPYSGRITLPAKAPGGTQVKGPDVI
jgi:hypothetical protein